jgi:signal transduction histidine kinase
VRSAGREEGRRGALTRRAPGRRAHLRPVSTGEAIRSLEEVERGRAHLWSATFVLLFSVSLAVVVVASWREQMPDVLAGVLDVEGLRFVFLALSVAFALYAVDRERRFRAVTHALIDARARSLALEERLREVSALQQVMGALNSTLETDRVFEVILREAGRLVGAAESVLFARDAERGTLAVACSIPPGVAGELALGEDLAGQVARTRLAALVAAPEDVARYPWLADRGAATAMAAPLVAGGELVGVLLVTGSGERRFTEYDLRLLMLFAEQAAVAVSNAQAYRRERESVARLVEIDRLKSEFIATITHELKTPLTSLLGYATILRKRAAELRPEQREELFAIMAQQGEKILRLIEELLQSSRIEAGQARLRREPLDLRAIVRDVEASLASLARGHVLALAVPEGDLGLYGDPLAIEHVLANLLENAIKYSPAGTTIRLEVEEDPGEVRLRVSDEGQGIDPEELPHIFERFRQANGSGRTRTSVGLGLYIVRSLVAAHGGRVWVESAPGRGTTFTVALPRRAPAAP